MTPRETMRYERNPNPRTYIGAPDGKVVRNDGECHFGGAHEHGCSAAVARDSDGAWSVVYAFPCARHHREAAS
jgi:hypothetical protein